MTQLYGSDLASFIKERQAKQVRNLRQTWQVFPSLAIIQTVESSVIDTYVRLKQQYGADILIDVQVHKVKEAQLEKLIDRLNQDKGVHGVILQLPINDTAKTDYYVNLIVPEKDVDGLARNSVFTAATPLAIDWLLAGHGIELESKKIALVGRGRLVGGPLHDLWRNQGHEIAVYDEDRPADETLQEYSLIVSATGSPGIIQSDFITPKTIVVDAGTTGEQGVIKGDAAEAVYARKDISITPKKGGVGPLTVAALFDNVIQAARHVANQSVKD